MKKILAKIEESNFIPYLFTILCSVLMAFTCYDNPCAIGNTQIDSSVFHYVARVMLKGGMPYRDTFDHKGPLIFLVDAFGLWLNKDIGVWIMELVFIFVALLFAYKIARLVGCSKIKSMLVEVLTVLSLSSYFVGGNLTEEYACTFIMVSLYIFLKFFKTGSANFIELIACGVSFGAVCLLRINMTVLWVVMFFGVLIECVKRHEITKFIRYVLISFVGVSIILVPVVVWLMKNDAFTAFINDYFKFSFMYISDPKRASTINIIKAIGHWGLQNIMIISLLTIIYFGFKDKKLIDWLCCITILLSVAMVSISGQKYVHYGMIFVPLVIYAFARLLSYVSVSYFNFNFSVPFKIALACMIILILGKGIYVFTSNFLKILIRYPSQSLIEAQEIAACIQANTNENDKISVCGNRDIIYLLSDRFSASVYSYQSPVANIDKHIRKKYISDIKKLNAKILVAVDKKIFWLEELDDIISNDYIFVKQIGTAEIYKLK